jgi:copper(I)-binding protein
MIGGAWYSWVDLAAGEDSVVAVDGAWARLSDQQPHTAFVYLTMTLDGEASDHLLSVESPVAESAQILEPQPGMHRDTLAAANSVALDAHAPTIFQPQGTHIILRDMTRKLMPGDYFPVTLHFEQAGSVDAVVKVLKQPPSDGIPDLPKGVKLE